MTDRPRRIQLSRAKGWRMPDNTVKVDRSTKWGNPYPLQPGRTAEQAVAAFRIHLRETPSLREMAGRELRGKNLACWCPAGAPCHADILLEAANG
ncbi:DUF4326 domain-containing protein [Sphingobium chungbukense]|uniref:DUF4326 domain-containing protein n=1 Tax=Sphingobium chungbukense TaxID=56193 RepID=A0A0M3AYA9_9SPHN|nr:DUF4326 domain-containing protein [Sphingobium chungbukense]KKW93901.1 hypothetical protein YP76_04440 [Sphingobium chungbukense]